jgi:hypothetical protein
MGRMPRVAALALVAIALSGSACKQRKHARVTSYTPPPLPAGFVEQTGAGWRVAVPATWKEAGQKGPAMWAVFDPQAVDEFHANVNVVTEGFVGDSYEYARANEASLRKQAPRATVDAVREDVVDGDPTLILESRWPPTPPTTVPYRSMQTALSSRGTGYVVTCSVSASAFERYRSTCESIIRSFAVER